MLRNYLSEEAESIICEADEIRGHRFRLLGYEGLDYGTIIDWHLDAVHGIRAPVRAAHKIHFLDYSHVGDHKVIWELNRHQHLVTLAKTWILTHEEQYVVELLDQWYGWQRANPYPLGINWASALEVAFRSLSWLWIRFLLTGCPAVPSRFEHDLMAALALNGSFIERYLSTYFSPNTHLLGELTALFFIGVLCPQISKAETWKGTGWNGLLLEAEHQVRSDGVYFEQSLYYHVYALDFFLHARALAVRNGMEVPQSFDAVLQRMLVFLGTMAQAGPSQSFGDDDGGRVFNPSRNRCEHLTDSLVLGAILFDREDLATAPVTEEALWIFGERALKFEGIQAAPPRLSNTSFEAAGIYVMASSHAYPQQMVIYAGPMGAGQAGHGHAHALSVTFSFDQRPWLIDPGTFVYTPCSSRNRFRGTAAHNTWTIDGLDQAEAKDLFSWGSVPAVRGEHWVIGETFALFAGSHSGYCRLADPVVHRRFVFYLKDHFWLVRDVLLGHGVHKCEGSWHFAPDLEVQKGRGAFVASVLRPSACGGSRLALVPAEGSAWNCGIATSGTSPVYGIEEPVPVVRMNRLVQLPTESALVIAPLFTPKDKPGSLARMQDSTSPADQANGYVYTEEGGSHFMFFSASKGDWRFDRWTSDADFLYCRMRGNELEHVIICGSSFAQFVGKTIFAHHKAVEWFERLFEKGVARVFSSDNDAADCSSALLPNCDTAVH